MKRNVIISTIGSEYLVSNFENDEFNYPKEFKRLALEFNPIANSKNKRKYETLDLKFVKNNVSVLIETKTDFSTDLDSAKEQLSAYVEYEKQISKNKIVAILINTSNDNILVWRGVVSDSDFMSNETALKTIDEYVDFYTTKINNKEKVMANTFKLNELLHKFGINEKLRSQFVGTCLLALKNGLDYKSVSLTNSQIRTAIKDTLEGLFNQNGDLEKAKKLGLLDDRILKNQVIRTLKIEDFRQILAFIENNILPYINDKTTAGQDLLNLFFITFNKYVGKAEKNQAFTPDHITDFMSKIVGVNKHSVILDPCCGSGSFLVRAMNQALDDCSNEREQQAVKSKQILGIEIDENIYGLAATNMLIHSDGNSHIICGSCFDQKDWIVKNKPNVILMNPPYNAQRTMMPDRFTKTWKSDKKEDPTKGFYFVKYIADLLNSENLPATLAVILPVSCAIGSNKEISSIKKEILEENTLDAVFTLPNEVFYPGASASTCCMIFKIGKKHSDITNPDTFFGYYKDDGFKKKKNLGRVEQMTKTGSSRWVEIENKWLELYRTRKSVDGLSSNHKVSGTDEWLCEAYMKTDFSTLTEKDFQQTLNNYLAYLVKEGVAYES